MTDQGNRLSYILINPSPDTRLELHDVVWVHSANIIDNTLKWTQYESYKYYRMLFSTLSVPLLQVPDQTRPPLSGTQSREQQEVQHRAHWEPQVRYAGQHPSVRDKQNKTNIVLKHCQRGETTTHSRNQEMVRQRAIQSDGPRIFSTFSLRELSCAGCAWTFSITMGMFYLCIFLFSKQRAGDTEVHLMKNCMYLYPCMCMFCTASCTCVCVCMYCMCVQVCEWMCMYAYGSRARHCQFYLDSQMNLLPNESQGMYFCVLLCVVGVFHHT